MNQTKPYPGIGQSIGLLATILGFQILLLIPLFIISLFVSHDILTHPVTLGIINLLSIGAVIFIGFYKSPLPFKTLFPLNPIKALDLLPVLMTIIGMSIVISEITNVIIYFIPIPDFVRDFMEQLISGESLFGSLFTVVIVAAFTEEFLFRGLILNGYIARYGTRTAIIISALLFGLFHLNPWQFVGAAILGAVFAWWFVMTGNLTLCVIGHGLNNLLPIVLLRSFKTDIQGYSNEISAVHQWQPLWFDLVGIILTAAGIWLSIKIFSNHPNQISKPESDNPVDQSTQ